MFYIQNWFLNVLPSPSYIVIIRPTAISEQLHYILFSSPAHRQKGSASYMPTLNSMLTSSSPAHSGCHTIVWQLISKTTGCSLLGLTVCGRNYAVSHSACNNTSSLWCMTSWPNNGLVAGPKNLLACMVGMATVNMEGSRDHIWEEADQQRNLR